MKKEQPTYLINKHENLSKNNLYVFVFGIFNSFIPRTITF